MSRAAVTGNKYWKSSLVLRFRYILFLTSISVGCFLILFTKNANIIFVEHELSTWRPYRDNQGYAKRYTIKTEGCNIPAMEPLSDTIASYVERPKRKPCGKITDTLLDSNRTHIWVKDDMFMFNNSSINQLSCCYQSFIRPDNVEDITSNFADNRVEYSDCVYFTKHIRVKDEFVRVICRHKNRIIYKQYYPFAIKKPFKAHDKHGEILKNKIAYNVLIMGIDAVSRLNFHRTMPKTLNYLNKKGAVELLGYNKVGDNTFPNIMPMLLGASVSELKSICLPHSKSKFDNCPFVWEWFKQAGYYTALGEDCSVISTFNYGRAGFLNTPTDYYFHTFINQAERNVGRDKESNTYLCMRDKYFFKVLLDYIEDLTLTLNNSKLFGFFWEATLSHDFLNYPMLMDDDYVDFFERLDRSGYLNDTIIFLMSDHGIRWGPIRSTQQGRLEERLPFTYILTPSSFRGRFTEAYTNLQLNSGRLTTPFDIHATLLHLVDVKDVENDSILTRSNTSYGNLRGISLFQQIPTNRTCSTAHIDDHWCTCYKETALNKDSKEAKEAATHLMTHLNNLLLQYSKCAQLTLSEIVYATEMDVFKASKGNKPWREYMLVIRTLPGGGMFEATLRQSITSWKISGTVSRLNLYGEQSRCVSNNLMKLYCYCIP